VRNESDSIHRTLSLSGRGQGEGAVQQLEIPRFARNDSNPKVAERNIHALFQPKMPQKAYEYYVLP
jgi:hypothetical protein